MVVYDEVYDGVVYDEAEDEDKDEEPTPTEALLLLPLTGGTMLWSSVWAFSAAAAMSSDSSSPVKCDWDG